ncbi:MAG: M3 family oligoendopeptidase, partial [Synergistota bacterium]|nr:M3 family oligoendopeptidase [Synergistota bacterium]
MPGKTKTLERNYLDPRFTWRLEDLFETEHQWEKAFSRAGEMIKAAGDLRGTLGESAASLLKCLKLSDEMGEPLGKIFVYAHMKSHQDTRDNTARAMADRATSLAVAASGAESFIMPEILAIPTDRIEAFVKSEKGLEPYRFFLERIIRQRPHVLSEKEEALLAGSGEMANAPETIFSMLTNADMTFPDIVDEQGESAPLTEELYGVYLQSRDRAVRKDAYEKLFDTYGSFKNTLAASFGATLRSGRFYASARNYPSVLESSLFANNIPVSVYTSLVDAVSSRLNLLHRYVSLKKQALDLKQIAMYDLYVPLVEEPDSNISWKKACEMVLEGLHPLGEDYCKTLSKGFSERWIDVYENRGKRSGAYSWGTWPVHPYVLLNFNGKIRDVF